MSLSVRGIARHFVKRTGALSVRETFFESVADNLMMRERLSSIARKEISFDVSECQFDWTASYEQTWSHVHVRVRLNADANIPAVTMATLSATWENTIQNTWSNRWSIGRPGEATCPITVDVEWVNNNAHHTVRVQQGPAATNMTLWDTSDSGQVAAHEFGHMLGNPDEYPDPVCPTRSPVSTNTVMHNNSNNVPQRLMQRLADNVGSNIV